MSATIGALLREATQALAGAGDTARLDAELLLCHALEVPRSYLFTWPEREPALHQVEQFQALVRQRAAGQPVAYLLEYREFYGHRFGVTKDTLIPRPETELLVDLVLDRLPTTASFRVLDLGTGSGAIALSLALARRSWDVVATDRSDAALEVARKNALHLGADNVSLIQSDWWQGVSGTFDAVVSNPPYIRIDDVHLSQGDVRFEPRTALVAGDDGLDDVRRIVADAPAHLVAGGLLALEHGFDQGADVRALLEVHHFRNVTTLVDLGGRQRITFGVRADE